MSYTRTELLSGLRHVGLLPGDTVFFHISAGLLGQPECGAQPPEAFLLDVLRETLGPQGTILVPTYTFSFCRGEVFDVENSPSPGGPWSESADFLEYVRTQPGAIRSRDPIHSVAGIGPQAATLLEQVPRTCFGNDSVHDRLIRAGGKICAIGVGLHEATFRHFVEEREGVPFRYQKLFTGHIRQNGVLRKEAWLYYVRILADNGYPEGHRLEKLLLEEGHARAAGVGEGQILAVEARFLSDVATRELRRDRWFTARGPIADPVEVERRRVGGQLPAVDLPAGASMARMIDALWRIPRDIVSDGYDAALSALATQVPMAIHEYPAGTECWSWIVPEAWTCHEAYLETVDGNRLFSYADHPLHVVSNSLPFEGVVSREELFAHLHVSGRNPDSIPFIYKYYERDWGLCCSKNLRDTLTEDQYRVVIRTSFRFGTLKVGEAIAAGESAETVVLCAHLCHPAMVNDDLTGVVVGVEVMRHLLRRRDLRYTYRLLIVPETIGSVAWLSRNEYLIPRMRGGLFLEMLGTAHPHSLQLSFAGDTEIDECFRLALKHRDPQSWVGPFNTVIGNDERQFNAPGVRVPMLSLSRVLPSSSPDWPYREYHSSADNPFLISTERLEESCQCVLRMIDAFEGNFVPCNNYKGELFCSRYGLSIDWAANPEGSKALLDIIALVDGTRTIAGIAGTCGISFQAAKQILDTLREAGLVDYNTEKRGALVKAPPAARTG